MFSISSLPSSLPGIHRRTSTGAWAWLAPPPESAADYLTWVVAARSWAELDVAPFSDLCGFSRRTWSNWMSRVTSPSARRLVDAWAKLGPMADAVVLEEP